MGQAGPIPWNRNEDLNYASSLKSGGLDCEKKVGMVIHNPQARVSHNILGLESDICELWRYIWEVSNVITVAMTITISLDEHAR